MTAKALMQLIAALCLIIVATTSAYAGSGPIDKLAEPLSLRQMMAFTPAEAASCSLKNHIPIAMAYWSGIQAGDRFASYLNPTNCSGATDYPFSIYFVSLPLYNFVGARWPVGVKVQIWSVAGDDSCSGPGTMLYAHHFLLDSVSFKAPKVGVITLPDPVCVSGPFFLAVEYDGTTPGPYPSVLFDTLIPPVSCLNWGYNDSWEEWSQFWVGSIAGNFMVWVDGYASSAYCQTDEATSLTIESLHSQPDTLMGSRVSALGYYTGQEDGKFVSRYTDYIRNEAMPPRSELLVIGPPPNDSFKGAFTRVTGYIQATPDPRRLPGDSVNYRILTSKVTKILPGPALAQSVADAASPNEISSVNAACDSCTFAVLVGGGANESNNHVRYWKELSAAYQYQTTVGGYCPSNVWALYYDGFTRDLLQIPQNQVDSCTPGRIKANLDDISHRIALCTKRGKASTVEFLWSAPGKAIGLATLRDSLVTGPQLRAWLQQSIDSSMQTLRVTLAQPYGGRIADSLKSINDLKKTTIQVNSAGGDAATWSPDDGSRFVMTRLQKLSAGLPPEVADARAADAYVIWLDSLHTDLENWAASMRSWLAAHPTVAGDSVRPKMVQDSVKLSQTITEIGTVLSTSNARPNLWARQQLKKFCEWQHITVPTGGQCYLTFNGDPTASGSVTVYKDTAVGLSTIKEKAAVWHWNIPGSAGYAIGNDKRCINGDLAAPTSLWIHDDNFEATITSLLRTDRPAAETPSNAYAFPGFSAGGTDKLSTEFGTIVSPSVAVQNIELPGFKLNDLPARWGTCGAPHLTADYLVPVITPWHDSMQFVVEVTQVSTPGTLYFQVIGAQNSAGSFAVTTAGTYKFNCGSFTQTGQNQVVIDVPVGCFAIDSWALRSASMDPPGCCVGSTGNVNAAGIVDLTDLSTLINYLLGSGGAALPCPEEANVNSIGIIDLSDLSMLISYLTGTSTVLPNCP